MRISKCISSPKNRDLVLLCAISSHLIVFVYESFPCLYCSNLQRRMTIVAFAALNPPPRPICRLAFKGCYIISYKCHGWKPTPHIPSPNLVPIPQLLSTLLVPTFWPTDIIITCWLNDIWLIDFFQNDVVSLKWPPK